MTRAPRRIRRLHPDRRFQALSELLVTPYTTFPEVRDWLLVFRTDEHSSKEEITAAERVAHVLTDPEQSVPVDSLVTQELEKHLKIEIDDLSEWDHNDLRWGHVDTSGTTVMVTALAPDGAFVTFSATPDTTEDKLIGEVSVELPEAMGCECLTTNRPLHWDDIRRYLPSERWPDFVQGSSQTGVESLDGHSTDPAVAEVVYLAETALSNSHDYCTDGYW